MKGALSQMLLRINLTALIAAAYTVSGASWWIESKNDSQWTNRPLPELLSEAQRTNALAQFYYARASFYANNRSGEEEAFAWLKRAAELGLPDAQHMLSRFYLSGTGTARDTEKGLEWARHAAKQGHADALAILADAYGRGSGVPVDAIKARQHFEQAIEDGSIWALDWFGHFLMNGEAGTVPKVDYVTALRCFERAASNGMNHAATHLVDFYLGGKGTPPNVERAVFWARYAGDQMGVEMMEKLASLYSQGLAEPRDSSETPLELFRRSADKRASSFERDGAQDYSPREMRALITDASELAKRYRFGVGTPRDYVSFAQWMLVLQRVDGSPTHIFGRIVEGTVLVGSPEDQRIRDAVTRVHRAIELGNAAECRQIGKLYRSGSALTPESASLAWLWLNRAVELKDTTATAILREVESQLTAQQIAKLRNCYLPRTRP